MVRNLFLTYDFFLAFYNKSMPTPILLHWLCYFKRFQVLRVRVQDSNKSIFQVARVKTPTTTKKKSLVSRVKTKSIESRF